VRLEGRTPASRRLSWGLWQNVQDAPLWQRPLLKYKHGLQVPSSWLCIISWGAAVLTVEAGEIGHFTPDVGAASVAFASGPMLSAA